MTENEKISIIVPVYKSEKYLNRCVESLVTQTYKDIEIILVDDGSPDNCPQMCDEWAQKDDRIKVIHKHNGGAFSARLEGVKNSCGNYIGFVDSDDWVENDMYEYLHDLAVEHSAQISGIGIRTISEGENVPEVDKHPVEEEIVTLDFTEIMKSMNHGALWSLCNHLYRKELFNNLPNLPQGLVFSEDMLMNYFLYKQTDTMVISHIPKYNYFRHSESAIAGKLTYNIIDDSVLAYNIIDADFDKSSPAYPYSVALKITNDLFLINSIIRNDLCWDRYEPLKKDIIKHIKYIFSKKCAVYFSARHKIGVILLIFSPILYNKTILARRAARGY